MDERVQKSEKGAMATRSEFHAEPNRHGHDAMMDHMQRRYLTVFLS